jgi:hypothetical protein
MGGRRDRIATISRNRETDFCWGDESAVRTHLAAEATTQAREGMRVAQSGAGRSVVNADGVMGRAVENSGPAGSWTEG